MDRAIIFLLCFMTTLCFSQQSEYLEFVKQDIIIKPVETLEELVSEPISSLFKPANRTQLADNREKHLQMSINLFRKKQYSILLKSMQSFERSYGLKKDYGFHQFFQMVILEEKLSKQTDISNQIISLAKKGLDQYKGSDLNLKFAFQKILIKYYYLSKQWSLLDSEIASFKAYVKGIHSSQQQNWAIQIETEVALARDLMPKQLFELDLPFVVKADYIIYDKIMRDDYQSIAQKYFSQTWHNSSKSLLNNLIYVALREKREDIARILISQLSMNLERTNSHIEFFTMMLNKDAHKGFSNPKYKVISKLIELEDKQEIVFTSDEKNIMPESLNKYIWKSRIEHFALNKQNQKYLKYLSAIPFYRLNMNEINLILSSNIKYLEKNYSDLYYSKQYGQVISHWEKINIKSSLQNYVSDETKFLVSAAYIQNKKEKNYYDIARGGSLSLVNDLEALKNFIVNKWEKVVEHSLKTERIEVMALRALAYLELNKRQAAEKSFEQVLMKNADIKGEIKQDFFMGYIRLITSSNKSPEYIYQRLNRISSGIKHLGVNSNRVNEAIEAHLIGLNMTLKKTSFEKLLTSVNFFLKNYPRSQFYSMINLTRAKILAQLRKIKESMEVLQKLVKNTNDEKIKTEALDELTVLRNK